jgi:hypothetical protein
MVSLGTAQLAGLIMTMAIVVIASTTNSAFAQQQPCGEQPYVYNVGCVPLVTAQMYAVALVTGIIALTIGLGVAGRKHLVIQSA